MNTTSLYKSEAGERVVMQFYDRILGFWPVPRETSLIPTRHGDTFVIVSGDKSAPPLFLLHGSCSNAVSWIGEAGTYSQYFRTYAVDIPGEPGRSAPNRPAWNGPAYAEWMEDLLNGLKISTASLLGLSQGGWTALKFATLHPERVEKLVLLTPAGVTPDKASFLFRAIFLSMLGRRGAKVLNRYTLGKDEIGEEGELFMESIMTHFKPRIGSLAKFNDEELIRLIMPVLLLGGAQDPIRNVPGIAARMSPLVPQLKVRIFPERGHVLINMAGEVTAFLREGRS
jgi:pimeloyl-ACP methyl ester carboxylesterase